MAENEEKGFVIRDRRSRAEAEGSSEQARASAQARPAEAARTPASGEQRQSEDPQAPVTFSSFVFSLGTSALMLLGEQLSPQQNKVPVNLAQAKEIIDILSVLEGKTQGNLTSDEQAVLRDILYTLRIKYVDVASGKQATPST